MQFMIAGCVASPLLSLLGWEMPEYRHALKQQGISIAPRANNTMAFMPEMVGQPSCSHGGRHRGGRHHRHRGAAGGHGGEGSKAGDEARRKLHATEGDEPSGPYVWEADAQELLTHVLRQYGHEQVVYLRRPVVVNWGEHLQDGSEVKRAKERCVQSFCMSLSTKTRTA